MDKQEEQKYQHGTDKDDHPTEDEGRNEQEKTTDSINLSPDKDGESNPTESEQRTQEANLNVDEKLDEQTDIYYQEEAVVAVEQAEETSKSEQPAFLKAGFWIRFWAYLIDVVIVFSINGIVLAPIAFVRDLPMFEWQVISVAGILSGFVYYLYFLFMTKIFQQTLGKMVMGIKVIGTTQSKPKWSDLIFREVVGRFMHNAFFILKLLYVVIAFTDDKKGVHDIIGNTRVIHVP